jgi:hypothetical protein
MSAVYLYSSSLGCRVVLASCSAGSTSPIPFCWASSSPLPFLLVFFVFSARACQTLLCFLLVPDVISFCIRLVRKKSSPVS